MQDTLGIRLKHARTLAKLSQNDVATIMHVTRQSVSKWENDRGYPDIDNLVYLSQLYEVSIDDLLKDNGELQAKLGTSETEIDDKQRQVKQLNKAPYQNRDEGLFLMILALVSAIVPPVGIIIPIYVMWRNSKYNCLYKLIYLVSVIVLLMSIAGTAVYVSDNWFSPTETHVYRVN